MKIPCIYNPKIAEMKPRNCQSVSHEVKNEMMKEIVEFLVEQDRKESESSTKIEQIVKIFDQARKSHKYCLKTQHSRPLFSMCYH